MHCAAFGVLSGGVALEIWGIQGTPLLRDFLSWYLCGFIALELARSLLTLRPSSGTIAQVFPTSLFASGPRLMDGARIQQR